MRKNLVPICASVVIALTFAGRVAAVPITSQSALISSHSFSDGILAGSDVGFSQPVFNSSVSSSLPGTIASASLNYLATSLGFTANGEVTASGWEAIVEGDSWAMIDFLYSFSIDESYAYTLEGSTQGGGGRRGVGGPAFFGLTGLSFGSGIIGPGTYSVSIGTLARGYAALDYSDTGWGFSEFTTTLSLAPVFEPAAAVPDGGPTALLILLSVAGIGLVARFNCRLRQGTFPRATR